MENGIDTYHVYHIFVEQIVGVVQIKQFEQQKYVTIKLRKECIWVFCHLKEHEKLL